MNEGKRISGLSLLIVFSVVVLPIAIMAVVFFVELSNYNMNENAADELYEEAELMRRNIESYSPMFQMPSGETAFFSDNMDGYHLVEWSPEENDIKNMYPIEIDPYEDAYVMYQDNRIIIASTGDDDTIKIYSYQYGLAPTKIEHPTLHTQPIAHYRASTFNNQLFFVGTNDAGEYVAMTVNGDTTNTTNFSQMPQLQNITAIEMHTNNTYDIDYPVAKISTYDGSTYFYDLYDQSQGLKNLTDATPWEIDEEIVSAFANPETLNEDAEDSPHAAHLFYPEKTLLNEDTMLIIGQNSVDENGPASGIITDATGQQLIMTLPASDMWRGYNGSRVSQAALDGQTLYMVSDLQTGMMDAEGNIQTRSKAELDAGLETEATNIEAEAEKLLDKGDDFSMAKVVSFVRNETSGLVLAVNSLAFILIPLLILAAFAGRNRKRDKDIKKAYANGGEIVAATLLSMSQTGVYVNEQPQVNAVLKFDYRGQERQRSLKTLVDLVQPPQVGDVVELLYDPVRDKLFVP